MDEKIIDMAREVLTELIKTNEVGSWFFISFLNGFLLLKIVGWYLDRRKTYYGKLLEAKKTEEVLRAEKSALQRVIRTREQEIRHLNGQIEGDGSGEPLPEIDNSISERSRRIAVGLGADVVGGIDPAEPGGDSLVFHEVDEEGNFRRLNPDGERTGMPVSQSTLARIMRQQGRMRMHPEIAQAIDTIASAGESVGANPDEMAALLNRIVESGGDVEGSATRVVADDGNMSHEERMEMLRNRAEELEAISEPQGVARMDGESDDEFRERVRNEMNRRRRTLLEGNWEPEGESSWPDGDQRRALELANRELVGQTMNHEELTWMRNNPHLMAHMRELALRSTEAGEELSSEANQIVEDSDNVARAVVENLPQNENESEEEYMQRLREIGAVTNDEIREALMVQNTVTEIDAPNPPPGKVVKVKEVDKFAKNRAKKLELRGWNRFSSIRKENG